MQKIKENEILQALAREYLAEDRKAEQTNSTTLLIMCTIGALFLGCALSAYAIYQSPQQQQSRALQSKIERLEKTKHDFCK